MSVLTKEEIRLILERVGEFTVVTPTVGFPYRISRPASGYSNNEKISKLQGKLSIMLEMAESE